jgi:hypothetical protein
MDGQIKPIVSEYEYIMEDEAYEVAVESGEPFRCVFFDAKSQSLKSAACENADSAGDQCSCVGSSCYEQQNLNELYSSYNYYCKIRRKANNSIGRKINQCVVDTASQFATKDSIAYYREVLDRVEDDGLRIINFEDSSIYKNFVESLPLDDPTVYTVPKSVANQIYTDLGLDGNNELFSVNVAPPIGAGNYLPSTHFKIASDTCFATEPMLPTGKSKEEREAKKQEAARISKFAKYGCGGIRAELERYYLSGVWTNRPMEVTADGELSAYDNDAAYEEQTVTEPEVKTAFFSARESCRMYEQSLITIRDVQYGLFDTQMQNYIEDNIAKMINNKLKSAKSMSDALIGLQKTDLDIGELVYKTEQATSEAKSAAEQGLVDMQTQYEGKKADATLNAEHAQQALTQEVINNNASKMKIACYNLMSDSYRAICTSYATCFHYVEGGVTHIQPNPTFLNWLSDIMSLYKVKASRTGGEVIARYNFKSSAAKNETSAYTGAPDTHITVDCTNVPGFEDIEIFSVILAESYNNCLNTDKNVSACNTLRTKVQEKIDGLVKGGDAE